MRTIAVLIALFLTVILAGPSLRSAPIEGVFAKGLAAPSEGWTTTKRFRGGERASVQIAPGNPDGSSPVEITIHEVKGDKLVKVVEDKGRAATPDFAVVFWYPPRDGDYKITISGLRPDQYYVVIR